MILPVTAGVVVIVVVGAAKKNISIVDINY